MVAAIVVTVILIVCLALFEMILPRTILSPPYQRKAIHVGMCLITACFSLILPHGWFLPIGIFFTIILMLLRLYRPLVSLADRRDTSFGELFLPLGIALAALLAESVATFQIALLLLAFSDTAAYIVGTSLTSPRLVFHKTLAGSIAYIIMSALIIMPFQPLQAALIIGFALTATELISPKGSDNLTTPIVAVLLLGAV